MLSFTWRACSKNIIIINFEKWLFQSINSHVTSQNFYTSGISENLRFSETLISKKKKYINFVRLATSQCVCTLNLRSSFRIPRRILPEELFLVWFLFTSSSFFIFYLQVNSFHSHKIHIRTIRTNDLDRRWWYLMKISQLTREHTFI